MTAPLVSIIVVTMNTPKLTAACLESVICNTSVPYELIVVSNSPGEGIKKCLRDFPRVRKIQNSRNLGYTKAANQGIKEAKGEFLCFLNSDTLVPPKWMERLIQAAEQPGVGAVGPVKEGKYYRYPSMGTKIKNHLAVVELIDRGFQRLNSSRLEPVRWLSGFCLLIPKAVIHRVGLFDERFFFGWEDIDYSLQLRLNGFKLMRVKPLFVYHQKSGSSSLKRHRQLVRESEKNFFTKWSGLLKQRFTSYDKVFSEVNQLVNPANS